MYICIHIDSIYCHIIITLEISTYFKMTSFDYIKLYNVLPKHLESLNLTEYEEKLKKKLLNDNFYCFDEFFRLKMF